MRALAPAGASIVDVRPITDVAAGHIPGAEAIPLRAQLATWLGWVIDRDIPIVIVRNADQDPADILWPALNIGVERIVGELADGMPAWTQASGDVVTTPGSSARTRSTRRSWTSASTPSTPPGTCPMPYT